MSKSTKDSWGGRILGMDRPITRRDFLNGVALGAGVITAPSLMAGAALAAEDPRRVVAAQDRPDYYPPLLQGMRGNHPGAFEGAHALRDGKAFPTPIDTGEHYDLIVVGGGISGLASAHFFRERHGQDSRILILDNHDDFGGHAKRNEFQFASRTALLNGGTLMIDSPRPYSAVSAGLMDALGIDVAGLAKTIESPQAYEQMGLHPATFFDRETFGSDYLATRGKRRSWGEALAGAPLSTRAREQIIQLELGEVDYLPGLSSAQKKDRLSRMSYLAFLTTVVKVEPAVIAYFQSVTKGEWAVGIDAVSALDCWGIGVPGFDGMKLEPGSIARMGYTPAGYADTGGSLRLHFPDGNATIARSLVRRLAPAALPGRDVQDIVMARVNYANLDLPKNSVRIRLNSLAIGAHNVGAAATARNVRVDYVRDGHVYSVHGRQCVLACYNMIIPYLVPELPQPQKEALHSLVKAPLVYTSVALRNWTAFKKLGVDRIDAPGCYHSTVYLNQQVNIGGYRSSLNPAEPMLIHMTRTPCAPGRGLSEHDQNRAGHAELLSTPFETFELKIRDQLARMLAPGGFDPAEDITGITVNRWPHGYAPEYNPLFDAELPLEQQPHIIARARFGNIVIANSDSGRAAYTDSAIDQAHRAVSELG